MCLTTIEMGKKMTLFNDRFLRACRKEPVDMIPVWYMRQAGRYDADYRRIREKYSLVDICRHPEVCYEVSRMPVDKLGVDAAILFSDIMVPIGAMGLSFEIRENVGPIIDHPVQTAADVSALQLFNPSEKLPHVLETIHLLRDNLSVPLIGFTGAPFTLASYMIEGGPSRDYIRTKQMMAGQTDVWHKLMAKLRDMIITYATAQVKAGAQAIQLFDSWVGSLAPEDFLTYVFPTMKEVFAGLSGLSVPLIYFGVTTGELLASFAETGATVVGVDWRVPISNARKRTGSRVAIQGNLDPAMLYAPWTEIEKRAKSILDEGMESPGFIFNLGHGVKPTVEIDTLKKLTQFVHDYSEGALSQNETK
jgi:uroporphyrinogen decarboxylase